MIVYTSVLTIECYDIKRHILHSFYQQEIE